MDIDYIDLSKDKLMVQNFRTVEMYQVVKEKCGVHIPNDYFDVKKICMEFGYSIAFCINNVNEIRIDIPDGFCIVDAWGIVVGAGKKYEHFLSNDSSVTELEKMLEEDIADIYSMKYDVEYLETAVKSMKTIDKDK